jgi:hypothetical protein
MRWSVALGALLALSSAVADAAPDRQLIRAASVTGNESWSPRRLFNAGLDEEEQGDPVAAVRLYLSARLSQRQSFADQLYARGAGLRLVRVLATVDEDAAIAAALLVTAEADGSTTDLAPLIRTLLRRLDTSSDLMVVRGVIAAVRYHKKLAVSVLELEPEAGDDRRLIIAEGTVGPFTAGDEVKLLVRRDPSRALAAWRMVAMGRGNADGWQLISVVGLPAEAGPSASH